ncbi:unnamed protein product [Dibothriocephalus latus]|uniref:RH1 domain-containing protein n=1 Tax=Dibothriocephalus latus TaxID=60516 RepID=A0A3P7MD75_DIBLA|nr:unnamed protein product [Dibothriocephalus latus]
MFTTTDVYSAASAIGQELQLLIDEFGPDDVESVMYKVITVLEDLEACVNVSTEMEEKVNTLREKLESLRVWRFIKATAGNPCLPRNNFGIYMTSRDGLLLFQGWGRSVQGVFQKCRLTIFTLHWVEEEDKRKQAMKP